MNFLFKAREIWPEQTRGGVLVREGSLSTQKYLPWCGLILNWAGEQWLFRLYEDPLNRVPIWCDLSNADHIAAKPYVCASFSGEKCSLADPIKRPFPSAGVRTGSDSFQYWY